VQEREAQIAALEAATRQLQERFGAEIADGSVRIRGGGGRLSVGLSDRILFASGQAELSEQGKNILRRVAQSLANVEGRVIQVEGHTDSMQPSRALQERFPTNWELSAARATNVVRFLSEECDIPGEKLVASAISAFRPAASNRTETGRRRNRRIELELVPMRAREAAADP
jgi:chemotaxis protein MotB